MSDEKIHEPVRFSYAEKRMIMIGLTTFIILIFAEAAVYYGFFTGVVNFGKYVPYLFYLIISVVSIGSAIWHIKHYRHYFVCTLGMMVGMTIGMVSGFMIGAILGATNGMFIGSVFGMLTGMAAAVWCIRKCGIMSILEGIMAGLMSGIMGAMTTVMLINDNITYFMPLLIGSCILITTGMSYMIYKENEEHRDKVSKPDIYDIINHISIMFILTMIITFIMVLGPRGLVVI